MQKFILIFIIVMWPQAAWCHGVKLFATVEQQQVQGMAYFIGGNGIANATVRMLDSAGQEVSHTATDEQGSFIITFPQELRGAFELHLMAGPGHSATLPIEVNSLKSTSSIQSTNGAAVVPTANPDLNQPDIARLLEQHLAPIRQQLLELQASGSALSMEKIIAGLGYIAGVLGLLTYIHYRRQIKRLNEKNNRSMD